MGLAVKIILIILFVPVIGVLLYSIFYPRESVLFGKRWQFRNEDLEPSDEAIKNSRKTGIIGLVAAVVILIAVIFLG